MQKAVKQAGRLCSEAVWTITSARRDYGNEDQKQKAHAQRFKEILIRAELAIHTAFLLDISTFLMLLGFLFFNIIFIKIYKYISLI